MDIDSDKTHAFHVLVSEGNFSKASKVLGLTQPALSQKIARLEDELEMTLIIRSQKGIELTSSGQELIRYCNTKKDLDESFFKSVHKLSKNLGEIRVAAFSSITQSSILPLLLDLQKKRGMFPFNIFSKELYDLPELLLRGKADFIFSLSEIKKENIINIPVGIEENVHIVPNNFEKSLPFLDHDDQDTTTFDFFSLQGNQKEYSRSFLDDINNIIKGVELGLGQAIVSKHLVRNNKKVKIQKLRKKMKSQIYLSYYNKVYYPEIHKDFIDLAQKGLEKYL